MSKFAAVETCVCEVDTLASPCFSDLHDRGEACLCIEAGLMAEAEADGGYPAPLPS